MKLAVINGSPRGKNSNSSLIVRWIFEPVADMHFQYDIFYASQTSKHAELIGSLSAYDACLIIFPLYTDAMPGIVKTLFERMAERKEELKQKLEQMDV